VSGYRQCRETPPLSFAISFSPPFFYCDDRQATFRRRNLYLFSPPPPPRISLPFLLFPSSRKRKARGSVGRRVGIRAQLLSFFFVVFPPFSSFFPPTKVFVLLCDWHKATALAGPRLPRSFFSAKFSPPSPSAVRFRHLEFPCRWRVDRRSAALPFFFSPDFPFFFFFFPSLPIFKHVVVKGMDEKPRPVLFSPFLLGFFFSFLFPP